MCMSFRYCTSDVATAVISFCNIVEFVLSLLSLHAWNRSTTTGQIHSMTLHESVHVFLIIPCQIFVREKSVPKNLYRKSKHILCPVHFFHRCYSVQGNLNGYYEHIFKHSYSAVNHGFQNTVKI